MYITPPGRSQTGFSRIVPGVTSRRKSIMPLNVDHIVHASIGFPVRTLSIKTRDRQTKAMRGGAAKKSGQHNNCNTINLNLV